MALRFVPDPGSVLVCDYDLGRPAAILPEMTKRRPVVVVSPRRRRVISPFLVVPFSTQAPLHPDRAHYRIAAGAYGFLARDADSWAKCDLVSAVAGERLDRLWYRGSYRVPRISHADLRGVRLGVIHAISAAELLQSG